MTFKFQMIDSPLAKTLIKAAAAPGTPS